MPSEFPEYEPPILRFESSKPPARLPDDVVLPTISADLHVRMEFCLEASHLLNDFWSFSKRHDPASQAVEDMNHALSLVGEFAQYAKGLVDYRAAETYRSTRASPIFQNMSLAELADVLDDQGGSWGRKPQFFHAISMIIMGKFAELAGTNQGLKAASLEELVDILDVSEEEWGKNFRRYYIVAFIAKEKMEEYFEKIWPKGGPIDPLE